MLKYQISTDKEENELLDFVMGADSENKESKLKDGELISTDAANLTQIIKPESSQ